MSNSYRFLFNDVDVCSLPLESMRLDTAAGGPDSLRWSYIVGEVTTDPHAEDTTVTLVAQTLNALGEVTATETLFVGRIVPTGSVDDRSSASRSYAATNGWDDLKRIILTQLTKSSDSTTGALTDIRVPRVMLGQAADGSALNSGQTMGGIIDAAISDGAILTKGTIDPAQTITTTEVVDTSADAALRQILLYHPDAVAYIAGQTMHIRVPDNLTEIDIDPCQDGLKVTHSNRPDRLPCGVVITFESTHSIDGQTKVSRTNQTAGASSGWPPPLRMTLQLKGATISYLKETIETRSIPATGSLNTASAKNFYRGLFPILENVADEHLGIQDQEIVFANPKTDGINSEGTSVTNPNSKPIDRGEVTTADFPRQLISGTIQPWMPGNLKSYDALLTARLYYRGSDADLKRQIGRGITVSQPLEITNALPKVYNNLDTAEGGESPISGLASNYWTAINQAAHEGTVSGYLHGLYLPVKPGAKISLNGYFETYAVISRRTLDILSQEFTATYGTSEVLNPKQITDLARALARNSPKWSSPEERTEAKPAASLTPVTTTSKPVPRTAQPAPIERVMAWDLRYTGDSESTHTWEIIPGDITYSNSDVELVFTITGNTGLELSDGDLIYLQSGSLASSSASVEVGQWAGYPEPYEVIDDTQEHYYFTLWQILATTDDPRAIDIGGGLKGRQLCNSDLSVIYGVYEQPSAGEGSPAGPPITASAFIASSGAPVGS